MSLLIVDDSCLIWAIRTSCSSCNPNKKK